MTSNDPCATPATATSNPVTITTTVLTSTTNTTICINQLPYTWNGNTYTAAGSYNVTLAGMGGCDSIATLNLTVDPSITPVFTITTSICSGTTPPLLPTTSDNGITGTWNPATVSNTASATYTFTPDAGQCATVTAIDITVSISPTLIIANPTAVCAPGTADITAPSVTSGSDPGLTYTYWNNAAATVSLANPSSISVSGTYYIQATTIDGCTVTKPVIVTINPIPTAVLTGEGSMCAGSTKTLTVNFTGNAPFQLIYTDGTTSYTVNSINSSVYQFNVAPVVNSTYTISSISDGNCTNTGNSSSVNVTVEQPIVGIRYPDVTAFSNVPVQLTARNLGTDYTYNWNPPIGLSNPLVANPIFNYDRQTEYTIALTSDAGCIVVDTLLVKMINQEPIDKSDLFVPKAWSPDGDGHNDKLFPIPVNIKELKYFRVFNRWGQLMFETNVLLNGWDGMFKGQPQVSDTYTWTVEAIGDDGKYYKRSGNSVLLR
jgi:gliding motility-associated-like protein